MADDSLRTPGAGESIRTIDIGGKKHQVALLETHKAGPLAYLVEPPDGDGKALTTGIPAHGMLYNGATADRERGNTEGTLLASAARTAGVVTANVTNHNACGVHVALRVTVASGTGGLQVLIQGYDALSATAYTLNAFPTAITATGIYTYELYPGIGAVTGSVVQRTSATLPRTWLCQMLAGDASSYTYSLGYALVL